MHREGRAADHGSRRDALTRRFGEYRYSPSGRRLRSADAPQQLLLLPLLVGQHLLGTLDALSKAVLELRVALALLDVLGNGRSNDFRDRPVVDCRDGFEFLSLFSDYRGLAAKSRGVEVAINVRFRRVGLR